MVFPVCYKARAFYSGQWGEINNEIINYLKNIEPIPLHFITTFHKTSISGSAMQADALVKANACSSTIPRANYQKYVRLKQVFEVLSTSKQATPATTVNITTPPSSQVSKK
uniref:Uncharacterized protein n=1 Tax=Glossina palpalis gambiensis TaxID=67801 RepID=A0A1B0BBK3_9MUSC